MTTIGYKIVLACENSLYSYNADLITDETSLKYEVGKWTVPLIAGTKLFYFDSLENAKRYNCNVWPFEIWKCEVENGVSFMPMLNCSAINHFKSFHNNPEGYDVQYVNGSMAGDKIKLLERVSHV